MSLFDLAHAIGWPHVDFDVAFFWQGGACRRFDGEVDSAEDGRVGGRVSIGCGAVCTGQRVEGDGDGHFTVTKGRLSRIDDYEHMVERRWLHPENFLNLKILARIEESVGKRGK